MDTTATDYIPPFVPSEVELLPQPVAELAGPFLDCDLAQPVTVPNYFPLTPSAHRIAIIGEAASASDIEKGRPFAGAAGALLSQFLNSVGIDRDSCFLGNVCQRRAPGGKAVFLKWNSDAIQDGLKQLAIDLADFKPDFCLLLGTLPLKAMSGEHRTTSNWRGSLFESDALLPGVKCMAVYHPDSVQIDYGLTGVCRFDYARAAKEARTGWTAPSADRIEIDLDLTQLLLRLSLVLQRKQPVALDLEGYCTGISCIGFATGPNDAFVVPFSRQDGTSYWDEATEIMLWEAVGAVLESPGVPKVLHNALYELFCLGWYGICIRGITDDTMMLAHELHAELEKSLGFIASIYTPHPYWKGERKTLDDRVALLYNGKDCCRTYECWQEMLSRLKPAQLSHYRTNVACLAPTAYMMLRGMAFDKAVAKLRLKANKQSIYEKQDAINQSVLEAANLGGDPRVQRIRELYSAISQDRVALIALLAAVFCKARCTEPREVEETKWQPMRWNGKRWIKAGKQVKEQPAGSAEWQAEYGNCWRDGDILWAPQVKAYWRNVPVAITSLKDVRRFARDSTKRPARRACAIAKSLSRLKDSSRRAALCGELSILLDSHINVGSTGQEGDAAWLLYQAWQLPKQYQKEGNRLTTKLATDNSALLAAWVDTGGKDERCLQFLELRGLLKQKDYLSALPDEDGRIRYSLNLVATPTGRMACYGSPTATSKLNMQTIGKKLRDLFPADGVIIQTDLEGSDSWTVAAYCASLGDRTMLDDLLAHIKCAKVLALIYERGHDINAMPREELRKLMKEVDSEGWQYAGFKGVNHGCYTAGHELLTLDGWVKIEHVGLRTPIAAYNNQTRQINFEVPLGFVSFHYTGNLYTFKGNSIDLEVTQEHRMPFHTNASAKVTLAPDMHNRKAGHLPTAGQWFKTGLLTADEGRLIAAIHSDGSYNARGHLSFHFKKQRKIDRIQVLLSAVGLPFKIYTSGSTHVVASYRELVAPFLRWGKKATESMLHWSKEAMDAYLEEYLLWDGHRSRGKCQHLFAVDKDHLDWIDTFLHLSLKNGCYQGVWKSGFGSQVHRMSINRRTYAERGSLKSECVSVIDVPVYCPTVSTGFVLVRRAGKIAVSGNSCYGMKGAGVSRKLVKDSYRMTGTPVYVPPATCTDMQNRAFFVRYSAVQTWHDWMKRQLTAHGKLIAFNGFQRQFYGRKKDTATQREALATMPQIITTWAIKLALLSMWTDPENRRPDGTLRVEPLLCVHDSIVKQCQPVDIEFARAAVKRWFNHEMTVNGVKFVIPANSTGGPDWLHQGSEKYSEQGGFDL